MCVLANDTAARRRQLIFISRTCADISLTAMATHGGGRGLGKACGCAIFKSNFVTMQITTRLRAKDTRAPPADTMPCCSCSHSCCYSCGKGVGKGVKKVVAFDSL